MTAVPVHATAVRVRMIVLTAAQHPVARALPCARLMASCMLEVTPASICSCVVHLVPCWHEWQQWLSPGHFSRHSSSCVINWQGY